MKLCNSGHEEVCYKSKNCPVCEALETVREQEIRIKSLEQQLDEMEL